MSKSTISTFELFQMFPDQESARAYFEAKRWPDGAVCPACNEVERIGTRKGGFYRCNACLTDFTIRTGTIFERSKVPLHKWLYAIFVVNFFVLGYLGIQPPSEGKTLLAQAGTLYYFGFFLLMPLWSRLGAFKPVPDRITFAAH